MNPHLSAAEIAARLGDKPPTPEQSQVIEAPLAPILVIAGAGSGKTKTMADRVVYLVANGLIRPDQILGVTFTRKAAGELRERVAGKLAQLLRAGLISTESLAPPELIDQGLTVDAEAMLTPMISTYHSYAQSLVSEYGMHIGLEPETELIGDARAWQLVSPLVERYEDGETFIESGAAPSSLPQKVLNLAADCAEHLVDPQKVVDFLEQEIAQAEALREIKFTDHGAKEQKKQEKNPDYEPKPPKLTAKEQELLDSLKTHRALPELVRRYHAAKHDQGVMDFGDLLRHAVQIAHKAPQAVEAERSRFKLVLLDEFQDTSHAQLELFTAIFGEGTGHAVTAVGDPNQSIYGFRGASAGQLFAFPERFYTVDSSTGDRRPAPLQQLTVAWRNGRSILEVANALVAPFAEQAHHPTAPWQRSTARLRKILTPLVTPDQVSSAPDQPGRSERKPIVAPEHVSSGEVRYGFFNTDEEEAQAITHQLQQVLQSSEEMPSCAVLAPTHSRLAALAEHLRAAGVPYQILGLSGLLYVPEVAEIIAYLRVLADPGRSDAMIRLLAGARYRLGPRDLHRLGDYASRLVNRRRRIAPASGTITGEAGTDAEQHHGDDQKLEAADLDVEELHSLFEALDTLPQAPQRLTEQYGFSPEGAHRLLKAQKDFTGLRSLVGLDLPSLIRRVAADTGLEVEVAARPWENQHQPTAQIEALIGYAENFTASVAVGDLQGFLTWLDAAAQNEKGLQQAGKKPAPGTVELLTVHASKGLEWDVVVVSGLREDLFPAAKARAQNWLNADANLPWPLRGDRAALPQWDSDQPTISFWACAAGKASTKAYADTGGRDFKEDCYQFSLEEQRRLAYVAVTRARSQLICTGASFYGASGGKASSKFLDDIRATAANSTRPETYTELSWYHFDADDKPENPEAGQLTMARWPYDPLAEIPVQRVQLRRADPEDPTDIDTFIDLEEASSPGLSRRTALESAAAEVTRALQAPESVDAPEENPWLRQAHHIIRRHQLAHSAHRRPQLPAHLSASTVVALAQDAHRVAEQVRRPVPQRPFRQARRGTLVHAWVEQQFDAVAPFPEIDDAVSADKDLEVLFDLATVKENFRASRWAARQVYAMEIPVETSISEVTLRGRIDAIFGSDPAGNQLGTHDFDRWEQLPRKQRNQKMAACTWDLVDWKTGAVPSGNDLAAKQLQLAVYRLAFSRLYDVPLPNINAHFVYLDHGRTITPENLSDADELEDLISRSREAF